MRNPVYLFLFPVSLFLAVLSGCGIGPVASPSSTPTGVISLQGKVHGGQQPVTQAAITLYAAGTGGNGTAAISMLKTPRATDGNGFFDITSDYTCTNANDQIYIVATGGNPGLTSGTNPALILVAALGRCADAPNLPFITIDEVTTVAAAWALAPFMTSSTAVASSPTNTTGLTNAFLNAKLLADPTTGAAATLAPTLTIEHDKLYALADAIAPCVNSDGTAGCDDLFAAATPPSGVIPTDTLSAALNIVKNPANKVADVFNCIDAFAPFATNETQAPNDWTMSLTVTGGGLNSPTALGVDVFGNVWVGSYYGVLSLFSPQGIPFSSTGYGVGQLSEVYGLVVDNNSDVWVSNEETPSHYPTRGSVSKFHGATIPQVGFVYPGTYGYFFYDNSLDFPTGLGTDGNGNLAIANYANSSVTVYDTNGNLTASGLGSGNAAFPVAVAYDTAGGLWLANQGDTTVTHVDQNGNLLSRPNCCDGSNGIAIDKFGNAWSANYYGSSVSEIGNDGTVLISQDQAGGVVQPAGLAIDAAQNVWTANYRGQSISKLAGAAATVPAGTALSPSTGFGRDASLLLPFSIAADASGNLWVANFANNDVVMFFGLATPTATPAHLVPTAP